MGRDDARRRSGAIVAAAVLAVVAAAVGITLDDTQSYAATTTQFNCPGQNFAVPAGVSSITFDVFGAQGGSGGNSVGGKGGEATATIAVTPGESLALVVGC